MNPTFQSLSHFLSDDRGTTLIEMSVVIPVFLTIGLGTLEFGNLFYKHHLMTNIVRDTARYAAGLNGAVRGSEGHVCASPILADLQEMVVKFADKTAKQNELWTTGAIKLTCIRFDNSNDEYRGLDSVYTIKVTAVVPYQELGFLGYFDLLPPTLSVSHQERVIGVR